MFNAIGDPPLFLGICMVLNFLAIKIFDPAFSCHRRKLTIDLLFLRSLFFMKFDERIVLKKKVLLLWRESKYSILLCVMV